MVSAVIHNPDRYIADLRQVLTQGKKRIGILIGAGAPASISDGTGKQPLIPTIKGLTDHVVSKLDVKDRQLIEKMMPEIESGANIEHLLTKLRLLNQALGTIELNGLSGPAYNSLADRICKHIGERVGVRLPAGETPYSYLVGWIGGIAREHAVEIFTPNYDLLLEEALERASCPYFDGFSGAVDPFFDSATVSNDDLPSRWTRVWKIHGSLGWTLINNRVVRTQSRDASKLIYPDHLKYSDTQKQPYTALFDRLKRFLTTSDSLLLTCGFSFADAHISAAIEESLSANATSAVLALQFQELKDEKFAAEIATRRPNMSVYAADAAIINGVSGAWKVGVPPNETWVSIRKTFWASEVGSSSGRFTLGNFMDFTRFLALSGSESLSSEATPKTQQSTEAAS